MADIITHQEDTRAVAEPGPAPRRKHALLGLIAALAIALTTFISGIGTAKADTAQWSVSHVYMNIAVVPGNAAQSQYYGLIASLRAAAGHSYRQNVMMTQPDDIHSLIRLDLTVGPEPLQLWFTGNNLYLRGFTDAFGNTYSFNDFDLQGAMRPASAFSSGGGLLPPAAAPNGGQYFVLPFGSDYTSMVQAANRSRDTMPISLFALNGAWGNLATAGGAMQPQNFARSLMFMIQFTSESARFYDTYQVFASIFAPRPASIVGVPPAAQEFENNWSQISQYAIALTNGNTNPGPLYVGPSAGTLNNFSDVNAHLAEGLFTLSAVPATLSHDEL
jgi:hypothetical protein